MVVSWVSARIGPNEARMYGNAARPRTVNSEERRNAMSRSGYSDCLEQGALNCYRANVERATRGKRGQKFFRDLVAALDAMPEKRLIDGELEEEEGAVCALGALRKAKNVPLEPLRDSDWDELGKAFDVAPMLAQEVMFKNDDDFAYHQEETPEQRWTRMRRWAAAQLTPDGAR